MNSFFVLFIKPSTSEFFKEFLDLVWWFPRYIRDLHGVETMDSFQTAETAGTHYLLGRVTGNEAAVRDELARYIKTDNREQFVVFPATA